MFIKRFKKPRVKKVFNRKTYVSFARKNLSDRFQSGDSKRFFKLRIAGALNTSGSGTIVGGGYGGSAGVTGSAYPSAPGDPLVGTAFIKGIITDDPSTFQDWAHISGMFDEYRANAIKIQYFPDANVTAFAGTGTALQSPVSLTPIRDWHPLYIVHDKDDTDQPVDVNGMIEYENLKVFNLYRPFTYYKKFQRNVPVVNATNVSIKGYQRTDNPQATQSIKVLANGLTLQSEYGVTIITLYITARNRI